jgi:hypothetical protein
MSAMNTPKDQNEASVQLQNLLTNLEPIYEFISWMGGWEADFDLADASKYEGALRDLIAVFRALSKNPIKFKAIIPTKLSLEIDGISNLIIGHIFNIHPDLLPRGYKTDGEDIGRRLGYILTGIAHTINDNGWTTKLEGQTIILEDPDGEEINWFDVVLNLGSGNGGNGGSGGGNIVKTDITLTAAQQSEIETYITFTDKAKKDYKDGKLNPNVLLDAATAAKSAGITIGITSGVRPAASQKLHKTGWALDIGVLDTHTSDSTSNPHLDANNPKFAAAGDKFVSALYKLGYKRIFHANEPNGTSAATNQAKAFIWRDPEHYNHVHISNIEEPAEWVNINNVGNYKSFQKKFNPNKYK